MKQSQEITELLVDSLSAMAKDEELIRRLRSHLIIAVAYMPAHLVGEVEDLLEEVEGV